MIGTLASSTITQMIADKATLRESIDLVAVFGSGSGRRANLCPPNLCPPE